MKIVIPIFGFGPAGGSRVLSQLANHWIMQKHEVIFICYKGSTAPYYPTNAEIYYFDNNGNLSTNNDTLYKRPIFGILKLRKILEKVLNNFDCDIILANHSLTADPVSRSINKAKKFYYIQAYEPDFYHGLSIKNFILKRITINSYNLQNLNLVVNSEMYFNYNEIKAKRYVPPGLDLKIFSPNLNETKSDKVILGTIGRKEKHKGTSYIIEAFKILREKFGNKIELHIAFGDKIFENIEGIKVFHPNGDLNLAKFYKSLNVYICAQTIQLQAIHYPIIECMACKVPVITTGYYPSNKFNSFLIPIENVNAISDKVETFMHTNINEINKMKEIAFNDILEFDWTNVSKKMINYFNE